MKHLMRYEGYSTAQRVDDILDKISKYGMRSLTPLEKEFLDAHKSGGEEAVHNALTKEESEKVFEDYAGMFKFEFVSMERHREEIHYLGTLTCPDLKLPNGHKLSGRLEGKIVYDTDTEMISPDFTYTISSEEEYEAFDFCPGYEYELDSFIDYVVQELNEEKED